MDSITIGIILFFLAFLAYDTLRPARRFPTVKGWVARGVASFLLYAVLSTVLPFVWDAWLGEHRLVDATSLGTLRGAGVGFLSLQAFVYSTWSAGHSSVAWRWYGRWA
jgi:hypothetical protein